MKEERNTRTLVGHNVLTVPKIYTEVRLLVDLLYMFLACALAPMFSLKLTEVLPSLLSDKINVDDAVFIANIILVLLIAVSLFIGLLLVFAFKEGKYIKAAVLSNTVSAIWVFYSLGVIVLGKGTALFWCALAYVVITLIGSIVASILAGSEAEKGFPVDIHES